MLILPKGQEGHHEPVCCKRLLCVDGWIPKTLSNNFQVDNLQHATVTVQFKMASTLFESRLDLWRQKALVPGLSCGVLCVILSLAVLTQYQRVTDGHTHRQTDTQTHDDGIYRASMASRGKKNVCLAP